MVKLEHKKARLVLRLKGLKLEWAIERRYWRNPLIAVSCLLVLPLLISGRADLVSLLTTASIYACIAIPLTWQITGTSRMNFGPQLFVGVGGFTAGLLGIHAGLGPWQTLPIVILVSLACALLLSPLTIIAKGLYFSLMTLLLPLIFLEITYYRSDIFRGETGISGIPHLFDVGSISLNYITGCYFALALALLFLFIVDKVMRSRLGLYAAAVNDNEDVANAVGLNTNKYKVVTFCITSVMIGIAGWLMAHYYGAFAGVTYLPLTFMMKILLIVMVGGRGEVYGAVVGAYFVAFLEYFLIGIGPVHYVVFPLILLILLFILPEGLYGLYRQHKYREYYPTIKVRKKEI